jgi:hypothetical protein
VLAVVLALVGLAVVAGSDSSKEPATLPVLGAGAREGASTASAPMASDAKLRVAPVRYEAGTLPGLADEAAAWTLAPGGADEARIAELAELLDVDGAVQRTGTGWSVGDDVRRLDVQDVAGLPWSLFENAPAAQTEPAPPTSIECIKAPCDPPTTADGTSGSGCPPDAQCTYTTVPADAGSCAADGPDCPMVAPEEPRRPADLPSKAESESIGRALLAKLGVDVDHAKVTVDDGFTVWNVMADPELGGLPTLGLNTSVGIGSGGRVTYANGWLGLDDLAKGDTYPLIGTAAGVEKLNSEQDMLLRIDPMPACEDCKSTTTSVEPRIVRVTGVRLGLQTFSTYEPGATTYLVPTYLFTTEDGDFELPVVAVEDKYLGQQPDVEPDDHGTPAEPGDRSCSGTGTTKEVATELPVQVCGPATAKVGEPVTFTVTGKGTLRDDCGSPVPEWGDGSGVAVCDIGCASLPSEPRELSKDFEHTYAEAGTYTVVFHLKGCGEAMAEDQAAVQTEVRVEG